MREWVRLVKHQAVVGGTGQSMQNGQDWANFVRKGVGLVKHQSGVGGIGQTSYESWWDWGLKYIPTDSIPLRC